MQSPEAPLQLRLKMATYTGHEHVRCAFLIARNELCNYSSTNFLYDMMGPVDYAKKERRSYTIY